MAKVKKYDDQLMNVLRFDDDDLEANRAGTLSARQIARIHAERRTDIFWLGFFALLFLAAAGFILTRISLRSPFAVALLAGGAAGLAALVIGFVRRFQPLSRDLRENHALAVEGRIDLSLKPRGRRILYSVAVGKMTFPISKDAFLSFKNRDPYCVYYAPHSKRILSVEWLRDDNPFIEDDGAGEPPKRRQAY